MDHAVLQQLPVALNPLQQQQLQRFQHAQQQRRAQPHRQPSRSHPVQVAAVPAPFHDLQTADRLAFYSELTPVTPVAQVRSNNAFLQTPISAVSTVAPSFATQPTLNQTQSIPYEHAYRLQNQQQHAYLEPVTQPPAATAREAQNRNVPQSTVTSQPAEESTFSTSNFEGLKIVPNPPNLQQWRERLFEVDMLMVLTEDEFQTYFPHADNIYSHRSTQRYKAKPFVSHYFDCRLKGRPAGTPKSDDPNKKKRKRLARERDLCDVKIKITEFFVGATKDDIQGHLNLQPRSSDLRAEDILAKVNTDAVATSQQSFDSVMGGIATAEKTNTASRRFYTIQRVNGTGAGGTRGEQICPNHRHTLEDSDKIKKNSIIRAMMKSNKKQRPQPLSMEKTYHTKATGNALITVKRHSRENELQLYGSCFCPFVQRVWIALEHKNIQYQYIEVDPYAKPKSLLDINPRGLVPALKHGDWGCYESTVLMEYLEDIQPDTPLLPPNPKRRAHSRVWTDHINRNIVPAFYRYLQEQDNQKQVEHASALRAELTKLVEAADPQGPFFLGKQMTFVDVQIAPWVIRLHRVLKPYRGWPDVEPGSRWSKWVDAIEANESVKATTSSDDLYLDSYERYAENRPNTSQLANAINMGRGLP